MMDEEKKEYQENAQFVTVVAESEVTYVSKMRVCKIG